MKRKEKINSEGIVKFRLLKSDSKAGFRICNESKQIQNSGKCVSCQEGGDRSSNESDESKAEGQKIIPTIYFAKNVIYLRDFYL